MKQPELKLGRPVFAGDTEPLLFKGKYLYPAMDGHYVLLDNNQTRYYYKVKPDLTAEPMTGDEVQGSDNGDTYTPDTYRYIGHISDGRHQVEKDGILTFWNHVRFPQQSKRDRVRELLESDLFSVNTIIDQIDYIYRDENNI